MISTRTLALLLAVALWRPLASAVVGIDTRGPASATCAVAPFVCAKVETIFRGYDTHLIFPWHIARTQAEWDVLWAADEQRAHDEGIDTITASVVFVQVERLDAFPITATFVGHPNQKHARRRRSPRHLHRCLPPCDPRSGAVAP